MPKGRSSRKWYQQKRWILGSLLLFPPMGIPLLWLTRWPRAIKIGGSIFSGLLLLSVLTGESSKPSAAVIELPEIVAATAPTQAAPATATAYEDAMSEATAATEDLTAAETVADWTRIARQWQRALSLLGDIPISSGDYGQAQVKIAEYERNYDYAISQQAAAESAETAQRQAEEQAAARQAEEQAAAQQAEEQAALSIVEPQGDRYVSGTCKDLKANGVGSNFTPGDANYTSARDRDSDGVACES